MLNPERAKKLLKTAQDNKQPARCKAAVEALNPESRVRALALMGLNENGKRLNGGYYGTEGNKLYEAQTEAVEYLEGLEVESRLTLFSALFPRFARHVEGGWQLLTQLPYQVDYERKAFRAPNNPSITRDSRRDWLASLVRITEGYDQDLAWYATWGPYLQWGTDELGILFAAAIDAGDPEGDEVFDILLASARGEHEVGAMGSHVTRALLVASRPDGWDFIERLLIAAQRQEGLRQTILETVDEAHPEAFRRMLRLILDHDLTRFSATVRAADVWFGLAWDSASVRVVNEALEKVSRFLDGPSIPADVLAGEEGSAEDTYLALWALAFRDAHAAIWPASLLLSNPDVERRFVGVHLLGQLGLHEAYRAMLPALEDPDLRVAARAFQPIEWHATGFLGDDIFERLERAIARFPERKKELEPLVWPWMSLTADRQQVAGALHRHLGKRSPRRLIPYLPMLDSWDRAQVIESFMKNKEELAEARDTIFAMVGDTSNYVREKALRAVAKFTVNEQDALRFEKLLTRKAGDLRRGVISLLVKQKNPAALTSAHRLLAASDRMQRLAGLEMLRIMIEAGRQVEQCKEAAENYRQARPSIAGDEEKQLEAILGVAKGEHKEATLRDGLGLFDPEQLTKPVEPKGVEARLFDKHLQKPMVTEAAVKCLRSLDDLVHAHANTPVTIAEQQDANEELLGNVQWGFPEPQLGVDVEEDAARLPLRELWEKWYTERPKDLRDRDGLELLRAFAPLFRGYSDYRYMSRGGSRKLNAAWEKKADELLFGGVDKEKLSHPYIVTSVVSWLVKLHPVKGALDLLFEGMEASVAAVPRHKLGEEVGNSFWGGWRNSEWFAWLQIARYHRGIFPQEWQGEHHVRYWRLLRWVAGAGSQRSYVPLEEMLPAYEAGGATEADLLEKLIGEREARNNYYYGGGRWDFADLYKLSARKLPPEYAQYPIIEELVDRCRERIIEVEVGRGDMPTAASGPALALRWSGGLNTLVRLLRAMGKESFVRGYTYDSLSKSAVFSHLIRSTFPAEGDTHEPFAAEMEAARIPQKRLIELAVYAPQWAAHVESAVGWPQLAEAAWWIHAHTKDTGWTVDQEMKESWAAQVSERTPLSGESLLDGAVDVAWFGRVYGALGLERWEQIYDAAKYAAGGGGYKRAQLFADAMLGKLEMGDLEKRITDKRQQDPLRALGLLPLASGKGRDGDILERYKMIQEFRRTSRQFGPQRQASEKLAAGIAMENLARTAGYSDPVRLEWAMEAQAVEDLAHGPLSVEVDGVTLTLAINEWGEPVLSISKGEKMLKAIPPKVKKDPAVIGIREREREVKRQASRMRLSLEGAMCRGDEFTGEELLGLLAHPVLAPMIERLVFTGDEAAGYPVKGSASGVALRSHDQKLHPVGKGEKLRIAHPYDLLQTGEWHLWQHDLFLSERVQPFKQVFRELYVLTAAERTDGTMSRRYDGHQVNPRQALALLGSRGWVSAPEEGVRRTFHDARLSAWVTFHEWFYTPADVDGLTLEGAHFTKRGDWKALPLEEIPPRVFSEAMRDLDLVVSVAHRGGVDPEASASTVEMRASLVRETCEMLEVGNVRLQGSHALIEGTLGSYSVHLGSGVVHRQPGGHLCIVPVHSQHRGRLFLPFADDDPKTAEVLSKVILLAQDSRIQDPTILEQILTVG